MLTAPRPESIRAILEVLFPDLVEDCPYRTLDDFVLQRRDPQWSLPPIGFRDPDSSRRLRLIRSSMDSPVQVGKPPFQVSSIYFPRHPVHPGRRLFLQAVITLPEQ